MNLIPLFINIKLDIYSPSAFPALTNNPRHIPVGEFNARLWTAQQEPLHTAKWASGSALRRSELLIQLTAGLILPEPYTQGFLITFCRAPNRVGNVYWLSRREHEVVNSTILKDGWDLGGLFQKDLAVWWLTEECRGIVLNDGRARPVFTWPFP